MKFVLYIIYIIDFKLKFNFGFYVVDYKILPIINIA